MKNKNSIIGIIVLSIGFIVGKICGTRDKEKAAERARKKGFKDGYGQATIDCRNKLCKYIAENQGKDKR